jgi:hypothetical protein
MQHRNMVQTNWEHGPVSAQCTVPASCGVQTPSMAGISVAKIMGFRLWMIMATFATDMKMILTGGCGQILSMIK